MIALSSGPAATVGHGAQALFVSGVSAGDGLTASQIRARVTQTLVCVNDRDLDARVARALLDDPERAQTHLAWCRFEVARAFGGAR